MKFRSGTNKEPVVQSIYSDECDVNSDSDSVGALGGRSQRGEKLERQQVLGFDQIRFSLPVLGFFSAIRPV
ncbi:hypothetical protein SLE2022_022400 [Rubroshorea leprosula]